MKSTFIVSVHAIEKHLDSRNIHASVFFSQHVMYESIKICLNRLDVVKHYGKRFDLIKRFTDDIGLMGYTDQTSKFVKVVYTKTRRTAFLITETNANEHV